MNWKYFVALLMIPVAFSTSFVFTPSSDKYVPSGQMVHLTIIPTPSSYSIYYVKDNSTYLYRNGTYNDNLWFNFPKGDYKVVTGSDEYYFTSTNFYFGPLTRFVVPFLWAILVAFAIWLVSRVVG